MFGGLEPRSQFAAQWRRDRDRAALVERIRGVVSGGGSRALACLLCLVWMMWPMKSATLETRQRPWPIAEDDDSETERRNPPALRSRADQLKANAAQRRQARLANRIKAMTAKLRRGEPNELTLLPRLTALDLPRCTDNTVYALLLIAHTGANSSTELTKHGGWRHRIDTQMRLLQVMLASLRLSEQSCRREVVLLVDQIVDTLLTSCLRCCGGAGCRDIRRFEAWVNSSAQPLSWRLVPPVLAQVPAADRINAFNLTEYRYVVALDVDLLILRDFDSLFTPFGAKPYEAKEWYRPGLTVAHHPYDTIQGSRCGIPLQNRGVGALMGFQPHAGTSVALASDVEKLCSRELDVCLKYSEQLVATCHFHAKNALRTLPCSFLYDLATPRYLQGQGGYHTCTKFGGHFDGLSAGQTRDTCDAIASHVASDCTWEKTHGEQHAVHFKGKIKPWNLVTDVECRGHSIRRLRLVPNNASSNASVHVGTDDVYWNRNVGACFSRRRGLRVTWADGEPLSEACCEINIVAGIEWRALRAEFCWTQRVGLDGNEDKLASRDCHAYMPRGYRRTVQQRYVAPTPMRAPQTRVVPKPPTPPATGTYSWVARWLTNRFRDDAPTPIEAPKRTTRPKRNRSHAWRGARPKRNRSHVVRKRHPRRHVNVTIAPPVERNLTDANLSDLVGGNWSEIKTEWSVATDQNNVWGRARLDIDLDTIKRLGKVQTADECQASAIRAGYAGFTWHEMAFLSRRYRKQCFGSTPASFRWKPVPQPHVISGYNRSAVKRFVRKKKRKKNTKNKKNGMVASRSGLNARARALNARASGLKASISGLQVVHA